MTKIKSIENQTFLFTGTLTEFAREEAEALVEADGGKVISGVSAKLNYLVVGEDAGSKLDKAKALGTVKILTEKEFLKMVPKAKAKASTKKSLKVSDQVAKSSSREGFLKAMEMAKNRANQNESISDGQIVFFREYSGCPFTDTLGLEACIGQIDEGDISNILKAIEENEYFESPYFTDFYNYNSHLHVNGIYVEDGLSSLTDNQNKSSDNFIFDEEDETKFKNNTIPNNGNFLCTFRNESIVFIAEGSKNKVGDSVIRGQVDQFVFFRKKANLYIDLLTNVFLNNATLERQTGEGDGGIFDTYQFLIVNGNIICCFTNNEEYELQYPFFNMNPKILVIKKSDSIELDLIKKLKKQLSKK